MAETTKISWCDATFNPWIGCQKISPACDHCYAENMMGGRFGRVVWGQKGAGAGTRSRTGATYWRGPVAWNRKAGLDGVHPFVFCASLADVFDNQVPTEWRADLFALIRNTPNLVWLLLTKRPQMIERLSVEAGGCPPNAALGCTIEDKDRLFQNAAPLIRAATRLNALFPFVSLEPLLEDLAPHLSPFLNRLGTDGIKWVIAGGETDQGGSNARPTPADWFRRLHRLCLARDIPFHLKQLGEWADAGGLMIKVGKKKAGRLLDGKEHNARPDIGRLLIQA